MLSRPSVSEPSSSSCSSWAALCSRFPWRAPSASWIIYFPTECVSSWGYSSFTTSSELSFEKWLTCGTCVSSLAVGWSAAWVIGVLVVVLSAMALRWSSALCQGIPFSHLVQVKVGNPVSSIWPLSPWLCSWNDGVWCCVSSEDKTLTMQAKRLFWLYGNDLFCTGMLHCAPKAETESRGIFFQLFTGISLLTYDIIESRQGIWSKFANSDI